MLSAREESDYRPLYTEHHQIYTELREGPDSSASYFTIHVRIWKAGRLPGRWPDGGLSEEYGHDGPGFCLGDGQTEAYLKDMDMTGLASARAMA